MYWSARGIRSRQLVHPAQEEQHAEARITLNFSTGFHSFLPRFWFLHRSFEQEVHSTRIARLLHVSSTQMSPSGYIDLHSHFSMSSLSS